MIRRIIQSIFLILFVLIVLPLVCVSSDDTQQMSGLVYGEGYSFWIDAPKGWVLDPKTAKEYGANVILYQTGFSFRNAPAVIYANTLTTDKKVQDAMKHEADTYKKKYEGIQISRRTNIQTKDKKIAHVQYYKGNKKDQTDEAVAFIQEKGFYVLLVLTAQSKSGFKKAYPAYEQVVKSYALSDIKVIDNTK